MHFREIPLAGAFEVELEPHADARGYFARTWCAREFTAVGLPGQAAQASVSHNARRGTLRGLHFQWPPSQEGKLVRCEHGAVYDVIVDLRPGSSTFLRHFAVALDSLRGNGIYIPPGFAHGFQTLADDCRVGYLMSDFHAPELAGAVRWDDPAFGIGWPLPVSEMSERDRTLPDFDREGHVARFGSGSAGHAR